MSVSWPSGLIICCARRAPAGLSRRAVRRRRRRLLRSAAAAAALTVSAAAVAAAVLTGPPASTADAAAYVVKRVNNALSAAGPGQIAQLTITTRGAALPNGATVTATVREWSYGGRWRSVTYSRPGARSTTRDSAARLSTPWSTTRYGAGPGWLNRLSCRSRPVTSAPLAGPGGCRPTVAAVPFPFRYGLPGIGVPAGSLPTTVAAALHAAISCGTLDEVGRQHVDGVDAIELKSRPGSPVSETIWVSPGTYLPVRVVISAPGRSALSQTADITWLPPTAQNLARLTVPIPAGFRNVPLAQAIGPARPKIPARPLPNDGPFCPPLVSPALPASPLHPVAIPRVRLFCSASTRPDP